MGSLEMNMSRPDHYKECAGCVAIKPFMELTRKWVISKIASEFSADELVTTNSTTRCDTVELASKPDVNPTMVAHSTSDSKHSSSHQTTGNVIVCPVLEVRFRSR